MAVQAHGGVNLDIDFGGVTVGTLEALVIDVVGVIEVFSPSYIDLDDSLSYAVAGGTVIGEISLFIVMARLALSNTDGHDFGTATFVVWTMTRRAFQFLIDHVAFVCESFSLPMPCL